MGWCGSPYQVQTIKQWWQWGHRYLPLPPDFWKDINIEEEKEICQFSACISWNTTPYPKKKSCWDPCHKRIMLVPAHKSEIIERR
jgi:hypothetical protein